MLTRRRRYFDEYRELDTVKRRAAPLPRTSGGPTGNDAVAENRSEASAVLCRFMLQLADQHPDIARHVASIGTSYEGRTIPALVIGGDTSPPAAIVTADTPRPAALAIALVSGARGEGGHRPHLRQSASSRRFHSLGGRWLQ